MIDRRIVKPVPGFAMTDEYGRVVPEEGAVVLWNAHWWEKRLSEGCITAEPYEDETPPVRKRSRKSDATETPPTENQSTEESDK